MTRIIISGGGTGGHIFPAIAIADAIKQLAPDTDILFVGAEGKMEMERVPKAGYKIVGLPIRGLQRGLSLRNIIINLKVIYNLIRSLYRAGRIIKDFNPDAVVGVGGYASAPIGRAAAKQGIPVILQEQNSYAGITNKILSRMASKICVAYEGMDRFFPVDKILMTGNPVRKDLFAVDRNEALYYYGLDVAKKTILITGGSLGAGSLNNAVKESLDYFASLKDVQVIWQCGSYYYDKLQLELKNVLPPNVQMCAFLEKMNLAYACADIVVARAGAGTISELCLLGKNAILVPSPNVAEDHQTQNAMALVRKNAAIMIKDSDVVKNLSRELDELLISNGLQDILQVNIRNLAMPDSDILIAKTVLELIKK